MNQYGDAITRPFWEAAANHELVLQQCLRCHSRQHYPRRMCVTCGAEDLAWRPVSGLGRVHSATTIHLQVLDQLPPPYQLLLIDLDEGVRMLSRTYGEECHIGDAVRVWWEEREGLPPLPLFGKDRESA